MFAIINRKTGKFICGTDYRYNPPHQITSDERLITYQSEKAAELDLRCRRASHSKYRIVKIEVKVLE